MNEAHGTVRRDEKGQLHHQVVSPDGEVVGRVSKKLYTTVIFVQKDGVWSVDSWHWSDDAVDVLLGKLERMWDRRQIEDFRDIRLREVPVSL